MFRPARLLYSLLGVGVVASAFAAERPLPPLVDEPTVRLNAGNPQNEYLTLERALNMALQNNIDARIDQLNVDVASARVRYSWGAFDPALNLNASRDSVEQAQNPSSITTAGEVTQQSNILAQQNNLIAQEQVLLQQQVFINSVIQQGIGGSLPIPQVPPLTLPQTFTQQNPLIFSSDAYRASAELRGRMPLGTTYGLSLNTSRVEHSIQGFNQQFFPDNTAFAGVSIDQPLLRDFGFGANLAEVRINRKNKQIARLTWEQKVIGAVQNVIQTYYEMVHAMEIVRVKEEGVQAAHKLVEGNQRRFDLGLMAPIDVRLAQVGESIAKEDLVIAKNFFIEKQYQLKRTILSDADVSDNRIFMPLGKVELAIPKLDRTELLQQAFQNRVEYRSAIHGAEIEDIRLRFARNQLLPKLDVVGTYGLNGLSNGTGKSFDRAFSGQAPQWSVGVVASIPLGNVQGRAQLSITKSFKAQSILRIKQTELSISVDVDTLINRIRSRQQSVETARESRRLTEEAVNIERHRLEEGQVSSFDVVETQRRVYEARTRELRAQADLDDSIVQMWVATGTLLQRRSIVLGD